MLGALALAAAVPIAGAAFVDTKTFDADGNVLNIAAGNIGGSDARVDVVSANAGAGDTITVQLDPANAITTLPDTIAMPDNREPGGIAVARVDGDRRPDVITTGDSNDDDKSAFVLFPGAGTDVGAPKLFPIPDAVNVDGLGVGDLDKDGRPELIATGGANQSSIYIRYSRGEDGYRSPIELVVPNVANALQESEPQDVAFGDFNRDGLRDFAVAVGRDGAVRVYYTKGKRRDGKLRPLRGKFRQRRYEVSGLPSHIAVGDLNRDGRLDLVTNEGYNTSAVNVNVLYGKGRDREAGFKPFQLFPSATTTANPECVDIGELTGDSRLDIVTCNPDDDDLNILEGQPGGFDAPEDFNNVDDAQDVAVANLNGGSHQDLAAAQSLLSQFTVVLSGP
jgi:hypothetical protein